MYYFFSLTTVTIENKITPVISSTVPNTTHPIPINEMFVIISCSTAYT